MHPLQIAGLLAEIVAVAIVGILLDRLFGTVALAIWLCVCLFFLGWLHLGEIRSLMRSTPPPSNAKLSDIQITKVAIAMEAPEGKRVIENIAFQNDGPEVAKWAIHGMVALSSENLPVDDADAIEKMEDSLWGQLMSGIKDVQVRAEAPPKKPLWTTVEGPIPTTEELDSILHYKRRMYFMAILKYADRAGEYQVDACKFWIGDQHVVHNCFKHNS